MHSYHTLLVTTLAVIFATQISIMTLNTYFYIEELLLITRHIALTILHSDLKKEKTRAFPIHLIVFFLAQASKIKKNEKGERVSVFTLKQAHFSN